MSLNFLIDWITRIEKIREQLLVSLILFSWASTPDPSSSQLAATSRTYSPSQDLSWRVRIVMSEASTSIYCAWVVNLLWMLPQILLFRSYPLLWGASHLALSCGLHWSWSLSDLCLFLPKESWRNLPTRHLLLFFLQPDLSISLC